METEKEGLGFQIIQLFYPFMNSVAEAEESVLPFPFHM